MAGTRGRSPTCCCDAVCACDICDAGDCAESRSVSGDDGTSFSLPHNGSGIGSVDDGLSNMGHLPGTGTCASDGTSRDMMCQFGPGGYVSGGDTWTFGVVIYRTAGNTLRAMAFAKLSDGFAHYWDGDDQEISASSTVDCDGLTINFTMTRCNGSSGPASFAFTVTFA